MIIGSIKEQNKEETRTALTPSVVKRLTEIGHIILLEKNIGTKAGYSDEDYISSGAELSSSPQEIYQKSQILLQILPPATELLNSLTKQHLIAADFRQFDLKSLSTKTSILRLELVPRTSVAQSIDILSTQDTVRGYSAALYALNHSLRMAPQLMTAAASLKAAKALVIGASITGLQAASVFKKNGCRVTILDINEQTKELASSVGADFVMAPTPEELSSIITDKNFILAAASSSSTGKSPIIISKEKLSFIAKNTVIVDTTTQNIDIKEKNSLTSSYSFYRNLYFERLAPQTASELWANNMLNLINLINTVENKPDLSLNYIQPMIYPLPKQTTPAPESQL